MNPSLSSAPLTLRQQLAVRAPSRPAGWFVADYPPHFEPFGAWVRACDRARDTQWPWAWADAVLAEQARASAQGSDGEVGQALQPPRVGVPMVDAKGGNASVVVEVYALGAGVALAGQIGDLQRSELAFEAKAAGRRFVIDPVAARHTKRLVGAVQRDVAAIGQALQAVDQKHVAELGLVGRGAASHVGISSGKTAILSLPSGWGKSTVLGPALAAALGCRSRIVDPWSPDQPLRAGALHLTNVELDDSFFEAIPTGAQA